MTKEKYSTVSNDCGPAPFEVEYAEQKKREEIEKRRANWRHYTRSQWRVAGRKVVVGDEDCARTYVAKSGMVLTLFSIEQTVERTREELLADGWTFDDATT